MPWNVLTGMRHMGKLSQHLELHARFLRVCVLRGDNEDSASSYIAPTSTGLEERPWGSEINSLLKLRQGGSFLHPSLLPRPLLPQPSLTLSLLPQETPLAPTTQRTRVSEHHQDVVALYAPFLLGRCGAHGHPRMP